METPKVPLCPPLTACCAKRHEYDALVERGESVTNKQLLGRALQWVGGVMGFVGGTATTTGFTLEHRFNNTSFNNVTAEGIRFDGWLEFVGAGVMGAGFGMFMLGTALVEHGGYNPVAVSNEKGGGYDLGD